MNESFPLPNRLITFLDMFHFKLYYKLVHWLEILIVTKTWRTTTTRREDEESYGDYWREQLKLWFTCLGPHKSKRCHWQLQSCDLRKTATKFLHSSYRTFFVGGLCSDFLSIFCQLSRLVLSTMFFRFSLKVVFFFLMCFYVSQMQNSWDWLKKRIQKLRWVY